MRTKLLCLHADPLPLTPYCALPHACMLRSAAESCRVLSTARLSRLIALSASSSIKGHPLTLHFDRAIVPLSAGVSPPCIPCLSPPWPPWTPLLTASPPLPSLHIAEHRPSSLELRCVVSAPVRSASLVSMPNCGELVRVSLPCRCSVNQGVPPTSTLLSFG
jgi:hypothetical protein